MSIKQVELRGCQYFAYILECAEAFQEYNEFGAIEVTSSAKRRLLVHDALHYLTDCLLAGDEASNDEEEAYLYLLTVFWITQGLRLRSLDGVPKEVLEVLKQGLR